MKPGLDWLTGLVTEPEDGGLSGGGGGGGRGRGGGGGDESLRLVEGDDDLWKPIVTRTLPATIDGSKQEKGFNLRRKEWFAWKLKACRCPCSFRERVIVRDAFELRRRRWGRERRVRQNQKQRNKNNKFL